MSIKKESASIQELYVRALDKAEELMLAFGDDEDDFSTVEKIFALDEAILRRHFSKGQIRAIKGVNLTKFDRDSQANVVLLTKALLILNKLVEEYESTGSSDLPHHIRKISEKIKVLDKAEDVFGKFQRNFVSVFADGKQRVIKTKLRAVRGKLDTMREIGYAARAVFVVKQLAKSTEINEIKDLLDGVNKTAFKDLMGAEDTITDYCSVSNPTGSDRALQNAINKVAKAYGKNTRAASESAEIKKALAELKKVREDTTLSVSQKITKQQEILDQAIELPVEMKEVLKVLNEANVLVSDVENTTQIGGELGLTKEQEEAMLSKGMTIISAGAGSGKTRVLSGKVAHLIKEQKADPYSIIACSFSRKSAQDLRDKIVSATGKDLKNVDYTTIGRTTHSIAIEMMNRFDPEAGSKSILDEFEQNDLLKRAIELAKKTPTSGAPDVESFFKEQISPIPDAQRKNNVRILSMLFNVERWMEGRGWSKGQSARLQAIRKQVADKNTVSSEDENLVQKILTFSRGKKILNRAFGGDAKAIKKYVDGFSLQPSTKNKTASIPSGEAWWGFVGEELSAPSAGKAKLFITKCKSRMISPTEAFAKVDGKGEKHVANAKIYGAYQYLLGFDERMDFDDVIIRGVQVLNYAQNLKEVQKQYKHIIVDEAQDLNPAQHAFFGLIAGTYEPNMKTKGAPTPVSNPSLREGNSFTLIGDENQSIYGFRGASRSEFTGKVREGFDLKSIGINFRSGESIVNAANMLVNAKEGEGLGLVCVASAKKSSDSITHDRKKDSSTAARDVAKHIKKMTSDENTDETPRSYGIACRTNAEIIPYALALLSEGVRFKSGVNPFQHKTTRAVVRLMGFLTSSGALQKSAVLNSWKDFGYSFPPVKYKRAVDAVLGLNNDAYGDFPAVISNALANKDMSILTAFKDELEVELDELKKVIAFNHALAKWKETSNKNPATAFDTALGYAPVEGDTFFTGEDDKKLHEILSASGVKAEEIGSDTSASESGEDEAPAETAEVEDAEALALAPLSALRTMFATGTDFDAIFEKIEKMKLDASKNQGKADVDEDVVVLDTVHGWKGLEAEHMYVPMNAGKFPSDKVEIDPIVHDNEDEAKADKEAEERLLGYVAVTRGMKSVTILSYEKDDKGDEMEQSEFIGQMALGLCGDTPSKVASALSVLAELAGEPEDIELSDAELDEALGIF